MAKVPTSSTKPAKRARAAVDWEAVERDYRINQLTVRQIAEKQGCSVSGMMDRAKREGWERDLSEAVKLATKAKVRQAVVAKVKVQTEQKPEQESEQTHDRNGTNSEQESAAIYSEIDLAANVNATIILGQQKRVGRLATLLERMTGELEVVTSDVDSLEKIATAIEEDDPKAAEAIKRLKSTTTRMNNLKTATEIMTKLNDAENTAFSIGENGNEEKGYEETLRAVLAEEN